MKKDPVFQGGRFSPGQVPPQLLPYWERIR
jgi:hypothetical protein